MKYRAPKFRESAFNCPHCEAYSAMHWGQAYHSVNGNWQTYDLFGAICLHCHENSYWHINARDSDNRPIGAEMVYPDVVTAPIAHEDMPESAKIDYMEARLVSVKSSRSAAALLRLVIQKICAELGESGGNINDDIKSLVKKGLPVEIQQALDVVRVVGNNAVHPIDMSPEEIDGVAAALFSLVNAIVEDRISRPKKLAELFESLPEGARAAIQRRDGA